MLEERGVLDLFWCQFNCEGAESMRCEGCRDACSACLRGSKHGRDYGEVFG
jgi:hypothetical protein